ncbi:hypothetical protein AURDEDRAFT_131447 [Auricularia subglabra TFB-10046 SS5]|uniref:F-box domain-containing protein n=1 Tax=Auricularia subglabra (strain TFB-10046 / SS5) TaxID=717982 RepID=J0D560_AURST|nr:hypothetical protein AURDEDRAFT_131447 [Auricularia subglabra TFB-10046 SS5]
MYLPPELWAEIGTVSGTRSDLSAITRVSKSAWTGCFTFLYQHIVLRTHRGHDSFLSALKNRGAERFTALIRSIAITHNEYQDNLGIRSGDYGCCFHRDVMQHGAMKALGTALGAVRQLHAHPTLIHHLLHIGVKPDEASCSVGYDTFFTCSTARIFSGATYPRRFIMIHHENRSAGWCVHVHQKRGGTHGQAASTLLFVLNKEIATTVDAFGLYGRTMQTARARRATEVLYVVSGLTKTELETSPLYSVLQLRRDSRCKTGILANGFDIPESGWGWQAVKDQLEEVSLTDENAGRSAMGYWICGSRTGT